MVIVDEKAFMNPPPPYLPAGSLSQGPPPFPRHRQSLTFTALPSHLLLKIVYLTFSQEASLEERIERHRKTLYWLSVHLRLVNRALYISCMHVLRSTYLPIYDSLIRPPYTSDPFPLCNTAPSYTPRATPSRSSSNSSLALSPATSSTNAAGVVQSVQRETQVLDYFIALKVREDVWADDSELHLEREESFKDLFDLMQPRSRLEDLVRHYGVREGVVTIGPSAARRGGILPLPFSTLSVSFSPRSVGLILLSQGRKRTIVQVARTRDEKLEYAAKRLIRELGVWLAGSSPHGRR